MRRVLLRVGSVRGFPVHVIQGPSPATAEMLLVWRWCDSREAGLSMHW